MKAVKDKLKKSWFPSAIDELPESVVCKVYAETFNHLFEDLEFALRRMILGS